MPKPARVPQAALQDHPALQTNLLRHFTGSHDNPRGGSRQLGRGINLGRTTGENMMGKGLGTRVNSARWGLRATQLRSATIMALPAKRATYANNK